LVQFGLGEARTTMFHLKSTGESGAPNNRMLMVPYEPIMKGRPVGAMHISMTPSPRKASNAKRAPQKASLMGFTSVLF